MLERKALVRCAGSEEAWSDVQDTVLRQKISKLYSERRRSALCSPGTKIRRRVQIVAANRKARVSAFAEKQAG